MTSPAEWPPFLVRGASLAEVEARYPAPFDAASLPWGRDLGRAAGSRSVGAWLDRLPPGARSSFAHAHLREEELVFVVSGRPTLRWIPPGAAPREIELQPHDLASFPAGTGLAHTVLNRSADDALLLVVGERRTGERIVYPEDPLFEAWRAEHRPHRLWSEPERPDPAAVWPAWRLETPRLVLRPWAVDDVPDLLRLQEENHQHLARWMPWARALPNADELLRTVSGFVARFASDEEWVYGIFLPDGTPIGSTGLHPRPPHVLEIGYWLASTAEGHGYAAEATAALTRLALERRRAWSVEVHCDPQNVRSAAVPRRLAFRHVATVPGRGLDAHGRPRDAMIWSMLADDLRASPAAAGPVVARDGLGRRLL
jgi:uncharacterized cupin superfamily protein/RimJ/RimL family protein N-acetyltransferase